MIAYDTATEDHVFQMINELYKGDGSSRDEVNQWLQGFQKTPYAWKISDELLYTKRSIEAVSFASQTIRSKVLYDFAELPAESHNQLMESILGHVMKMDNQVALTQLCLSLADLVLQMAPTNDYLMKLLSQLEQKQIALLTIMTLLPEEYSNKKLRLGDQRRNQIYEEFERICPQILHLIQAIFEREGANVEVRQKCFKSLEQWLMLRAAPQTMLTRMPLLEPAFVTLGDLTASSNLHEAATDLICSALYLCEDLARYHELVEYLKTKIYGLGDVYKRAKSDEDIDKCLHLSRLFTELGETLVEIICNHPGDGLGELQTVSLVLEGLDHFDWEVSYVTFNFWYRLTDLLQQNDQNTETFKPLLEKLLHSLTGLCQSEPDSLEPPRDDFEDFRFKCVGIVKDITYLLTGPHCFAIMFNLLKTESASAECSWDRTEAILWVLSAIAPLISTKVDCPSVHDVLNAVFNLPQDAHPCLRLTSLKLIGELHLWISHNSENWLEKAVQYLLAGLTVGPELAIRKDFQLAAGESMKLLCTSSRRQLSAHYQGLLSATDGILDQLDWQAAYKMLTGISYVISEVPIDVQEECISKLVGRQAQIIEQSLVDARRLPHLPLGTVLFSFKAFKWLLNRISTIFRYLKAPAGKLPHTKTVEEMLPILSKSLSKWQADYRIVERICKCLRFIIRFLSRNSGPILEIMAQPIVAVYTAHRHSCFLYLTSILVDEIGDNYSADLQSLFTMLARPTLEQLDQHDGLRQNPDTVDDWCRLAARMGQKTSAHFYTQPAFQSAFESAIAATKLDHRDASASVYKFLIQIVDTAPNEVYHPLAGQLFSCPLDALLWTVPSYQVEDVAELYRNMRDRDAKALEQAVTEGLEKVFADPRAKFGATTEQLSHFKSDMVQAQSESAIGACLRDFIRLYR